MNNKKKGYLLLASIAILALVGFGVKAAIDYKLIFWQEAGKAFGTEKAKTVDLSLEESSEDSAEIGINAYLAPVLSESTNDASTSTIFSEYVPYLAKITAGNITLKDDGYNYELYRNGGTEIIECATSTTAYPTATSTAHAPFWVQSYTTSTGWQSFATSTAEVDSWQTIVSAGETIVCYPAYNATYFASSTLYHSIATSTGSIKFDLMPL